MRDLTKTMEIMKEAEGQDDEEDGEGNKKVESETKPPTTPTADSADTAEKRPIVQDNTEAGGYSSATPVRETEHASTSGNSSRPSTPRGVPTRHLLMEKSEEEMEAMGMSEQEKELKRKERRKGGLSKEQRDELDAFERERKRIRDERIDTLSKKLTDRICVWTETDKGPDMTRAFNEKIKYEVENLKMESFGIDILHGEANLSHFCHGRVLKKKIAIGMVYASKGAAFLKSQKFLGISGFFSRLKDKSILVKETWGTISTAIDAQMTMEEMAKMEEKGGEDWTDEKKAEYERKVTGKILAAAWRGSKFEIQSVLRLTSILYFL
jgi:hypothetical protein